MCGHIIRPLQRMFIVRLVLRHQVVEDTFHIAPHIGVVIFVYAQSTTRMFREDINDTRLWQLWQLANYLARYEVKSSCSRFQFYLYLIEHCL